MRKMFGKLVMFLFALTALIHADENHHSSHLSKFVACEKMYLHPDQVAITQDGIFCFLNEQWITTEALHYDASGLFITNMSDEWSLHWTCKKCGYSNPAWRNTCSNCGHRPAK